MASATVGWALDAIRLLAGLIFGHLGVGGIVAVGFGAVLVCSLAANAAKFLSHPKGMAFSGIAVLAGLGLVRLVPPMPKPKVVETIVKEVIREIPPPVVATLNAKIAGLEAEDGRQKVERAAQAEAARRDAEARSAAEARLRQVEHDLKLARQQAAKTKTPAPTGECIACGHLMHVGRGLLGENIRCGNCSTIMSARSARARRSYMLNIQAGQIKNPKHLTSATYSDVPYSPMFE